MNTFYHGTSKVDAKSILKNGVDQSKSEKGYFGRGFYMAYDRDLAQSNYANFSGDSGAVLEVSISPSARILDLHTEDGFNKYKSLKYKGVRITDLFGSDNFHEIMTSLGVDGIIDNSFGGIVIYNTDVITSIKLLPSNKKKGIKIKLKHKK